MRMSQWLFVFLAGTCAGSADARNRLNRLYTVPAYTGASEVFLVVDLTLVGCGWPENHLARTRVSEQGGIIMVVIEAEPRDDFCQFTNVPFQARHAVPLAHFLGRRALNPSQEVRLEVREDRGATVAGSVMLTAVAETVDVLPAAGAWRADHGTRLWLDLEGDGLTLAFTSYDIGELDPVYDWPAPGNAVGWQGLAADRGYSPVSYLEIAPIVIQGQVDQYPSVRTVDSGHLAFSDPFHGFLSLPSGAVVAISKNHGGGEAISLRSDPDGWISVPDLSGEWVWFAEGTNLHGKRTRLTLIGSESGSTEWGLELVGSSGAGRLLCTNAGICTVYLSMLARTPPRPELKFAAGGLGDRSILRDGRAVAFRVK